jgi:hypothetical protein
MAAKLLKKRKSQKGNLKSELNKIVSEKDDIKIEKSLIKNEKTFYRAKDKMLKSHISTIDKHLSDLNLDPKKNKLLNNVKSKIQKEININNADLRFFKQVLNEVNKSLGGENIAILELKNLTVIPGASKRRIQKVVLLEAGSNYQQHQTKLDENNNEM